MMSFDEVRPLQLTLKKYRGAGRSIGFVPTMGALHQGHLDLVARSREECDITVVSIFVNPTQFNNPEDLEKYPRTLEDDLSKLRAMDVEFVFHPPVDEIYPRELDTRKDFVFDGLDEVMEGEFRPGHFAGVAQVVNRLLDIVQPDCLFMGQKDFQQVAIIRKMLEQTTHHVKLVMCPTRREPSGLAMSSRNVRLSPSTKEKAACIFEGLSWIRSNAETLTVDQLKADFREKCQIPPFEVEYIEIAVGDTLRPVSNLSDHSYVVACAAVWADGVRLIDNMIIKDSRAL